MKIHKVIDETVMYIFQLQARSRKYLSGAIESKYYEIFLLRSSNYEVILYSDSKSTPLQIAFTSQLTFRHPA